MSTIDPLFVFARAAAARLATALQSGLARRAQNMAMRPGGLDAGLQALLLTHGHAVACARTWHTGESSRAQRRTTSASDSSSHGRPCISWSTLPQKRGRRSGSSRSCGTCESPGAATRAPSGGAPPTRIARVTMTPSPGSSAAGVRTATPSAPAHCLGAAGYARSTSMQSNRECRGYPTGRPTARLAYQAGAQERRTASLPDLEASLWRCMAASSM